jgi:Ni/Co efflux regulator RcnB
MLHGEHFVNYKRDGSDTPEREHSAPLLCAEGEFPMKTLLISTFALCLASAAPTALWAADEHHEQGAEHSAQPQQHAPAARPAGGGHMQDHATTQHQTGMSHAAAVHPANTSTRHRAMAGQGSQNNGHSTTHVRVAIDVTSYHKNITAERQYHFGNYNAPQGYEYHRYGYGDRLPQGYFVQSYWISNYLNFGLIGPPDGYVWVRYGPDAVLVDEDTGEIVQVVYGQFY